MPPYFLSILSGSIISGSGGNLSFFKKLIFAPASSSMNFLMRFQLQLRNVDGLRMTIFSRHPPKLIYITLIMAPINLTGKSKSPNSQVSIIKIQFSTFPGTNIYFLTMPKKIDNDSIMSSNVTL